MSGADRFISYAQHGEDVILWRALGDRSPVTYVDVGAFHPTEDSVTRALYERGWRGVNIEAQPDRIADFETERPEDVNVSLAIGDRDGTINLTVPQNPGWASILDPSSTGADPRRSDLLEVPVRRLDTLLPELGIDHVDVLKVDVEGAEPAVIRGLLAGPVRPVVCVVEGAAPGLGRAAGDEAVAMLVAAGYTHCMFDGLNHYLTTDPRLVAALSVPASPVDEYVPILVHRLLDEREHFHRAIAALASDNLALHDASARVTERPHVPNPPSGVPSATAPSPTMHPGTAAVALAPSVTSQARRSPSQADARGGATAADRDFQGGDLPVPTDDNVNGAESALTVATSAVPYRTPASPLGLPPRPPSFVSPSVRTERRRATFTRLLSGVLPTLPPPAPGADANRLDPLMLATLAPAEAVSVLYRVILGRPADADGLTAWTGHIEAGEPLLLVARALAGSEEAMLQPPVQQRRVEADLRAWVSLLALDELGVGGSDVGRSYRPGFVAHEVFVEALYEVALQRRPTAEESRHEVSKLAEGTGREWLLRAFAARPDARARLLGAARPGLRGAIRDWRDRRAYLDTFRSLVAGAESRQIARLLMHLTLADPIARSAAPLTGPSEEQ